MSNAQLPPRGWYDDPEIRGGLRYWDGAAWAQRWEGSGPAQDRRTEPVGGAFTGLARVVQAGLAVAVLANLGHAAVYVWGLGMFDDAVAAGDLDQLSAFDSLNFALSVLASLATVVTGVCWTVWQYLLARAVPPDALRRGPGWHAGSWFIPFGNFVLPVQNVLDLWDGLAAGRRRTLIGWWWAAWLIGSFASRIVAAGRADDLDELRSHVEAGLFGSVVLVAAAALAMVIVRTLTSKALAAALSPGATPAG